LPPAGDAGCPLGQGDAESSGTEVLVQLASTLRDHDPGKLKVQHQALLVDFERPRRFVRSPNLALVHDETCQE